MYGRSSTLFAHAVVDSLCWRKNCFASGRLYVKHEMCSFIYLHVLAKSKAYLPLLLLIVKEQDNHVVT